MHLARRLFSKKAYRDLLVESKGSGVVLVTLNKPKSLNSLCDNIMKELTDALSDLNGDAGVRAVVLTGADKAFAAGADIKEMNDKDISTVIKTDMLGFWQDISRINKPIIAAVNGFALGGGCELAMMCDIIIASDKAVFGQPEILLGTIPGSGGTQRLTRIVGKSLAMELVLTGRKLSASEAEKHGLVSRVVPAANLIDEAISLASDIARNSMPVVALAKECVNRAYETSLAEGLLFERRVFNSTFGLADRAEGMDAFEQKRKPQWKDQ